MTRLSLSASPVPVGAQALELAHLIRDLGLLRFSASRQPESEQRNYEEARILRAQNAFTDPNRACRRREQEPVDLLRQPGIAAGEKGRKQREQQGGQNAE